MEKADFTAYGTRITDTVEPFWAHPLSISTNTVQRVALWAKIGASPGMVGDSLWEVPVQEGVHPPQNGPQIPEENPLEAWSVQRQLVHELWSPGGDCATKAEGTMPWLSAPAGAHAPTGSATWKEGRQARVPPPWRSSAGDSAGDTWHEAKWRTGLGCAVKPLSPTPNHPPTRVEEGTAGPLHLCYTQSIPEEELSQFLLTRWGKSSRGRSGNHLVGFKGEKHMPRHGWTWAWRVR